MGVFGDWARTYWELGYSIVPIAEGEKYPVFDYSIYRDKACSEQTLDKWIKKHPNGNIAIVPGPASGVVMIDLDIKNQPELLDKALALCPRSPIERFGSKGLGIVVKYDGQTGRKLSHKGVEIGEMIVNTVFVIPPSIHPETKKPYEWTGYLTLDAELKEDILAELPTVTDADMNQFEYQLENSGVEVDPGYFKAVTSRNNKLKAICGSYISKGMLPEQIAPRLLAEDYLLHKDNPLFEDDKEFRGRVMNPLGNAYVFASSIFKTYVKQASQKGDAIPQFDRKESKKAKENTEYSKYKTFFSEKLSNCKKDMIDGILKAKDHRGFWQPVGNSIKALRSYGSDEGLAVHKMDSHYARYEREHKTELLFEKQSWDGNDHIASMARCVKSSNMTEEETVQMFKHWLVRAVDRIKTGEQNTMVLLQGGQGVGKDIFIENLCSGFAPYFSNFTDASQEKDMFMQVSKNLIINISEFDKLNKKHPGMIKDLISRRTAQFRPSHMQYFQDFAMNASFIGSVNPKDFLTDHTGNRRFWVFEDVDIDWSYKKGLGAQVLAQALDLSERLYTCDSSIIKKMNDHVMGMGPENQDDVIVDIWNSTIDEILRMKARSPDGNLRSTEVQQAMETIQRYCGMKSLRKAQSTIKRLGGQSHLGNNGGRVYHKIQKMPLYSEH